MIINIVRSTPKPQFKQLFIEEMARLAKLVRQEEGNIRYELLVDPAENSRLVLYEEWNTQAALETHLQQPYLKEQHDRARSWFDGLIQMTTLDASVTAQVEY